MSKSDLEEKRQRQATGALPEQFDIDLSKAAPIAEPKRDFIGDPVIGQALLEQALETIDEMARQRDEPYDELNQVRKQRHLEQVAASLQKAKLERAVTERDELLAACKASTVAIDDWLHLYAPEMCDEKHVAETHARIEEAGAPLAYIAATLERNRAAIARCQPAEKGDA